MHSNKRIRLSRNGEDEDASSESEMETGLNPEEDSDSVDVSDENASEADSIPTEDEIAVVQRSRKSKKTQKRKRRATSPSHFGSTLQNLLKTDVPSNAPLALKPSVAKLREEEVIETKARRLLEGEKKEKEEKCHVTDVIGGWGGESERSFRKVAQRGGECIKFLLQAVYSSALPSCQALQRHPASSNCGANYSRRSKNSARIWKAHLTCTSA